MGLERIDSNFERSPTVGKMISKSIAGYREIVPERKSQSMQQTSFFVYFKKLPQSPQASAAANHPDQSAAVRTEARPSTSTKITTPWRHR